MSPKYEFQKTLVVSTAHISSTDNTALSVEGVSKKWDVPILIVDSFRYGFNIHIDLDKDEPKVEDGPNWPYSDALKKLIQLARSLDCDYLKLDRDGETYDGLETFDW